MTKENGEIWRPSPFNPLDKTNLGQSVFDALTKSSLFDLVDLPCFVGAGVYAIYYVGKSFLYLPVGVAANEERPIYVGKAVPSGARKGVFPIDIDPGTVLYRRLREHIESINDVDNLSVKDFRCRFLVVDDIWIPLAESLLIKTFLPLWNVVVEGFGNHDPGKGRVGQQKSLWDSLHSGRNWAERLRPNDLSNKEILERIKAWKDGRD